MKPQTKYCAIYTRKSSEEGLEQDFNSLDAQWESCLAYITSQKSEGWQAVNDRYDDGGYSGGNLERPAIKRLMADIKAGKVHTVVVYKIDRLTRSLMDFSKMVEVFDQYGVTFVSVTQSFNTTTSMGRLTLNVLLSFAQFEREVTGERIRDKVAASKKKGMWMGGVPPMGYDLADKKLHINQAEADIVRHIYRKYLQLGSVERLKQDLEKNNIISKIRVSVKGRESGGANFSRGALYHLLRNPVFIGKTKHRDIIHEGLHDAILDEDLWQRVQHKLADQTVRVRGSKKIKSESEILKGKLFDIEGNFYSPTYANKNGKRYNYYISQALLQYKDHPMGILARLPAYELEKAVENGFREKIIDVLKLEAILDYQVIEHITKNNKEIKLAKLITAISKIIIGHHELKILIDTKILRSEIK